MIHKITSVGPEKKNSLDLNFQINSYTSLTGVTQLVGNPPAKQMVASLIPGQGTFLVVGSVPGGG